MERLYTVLKNLYLSILIYLIDRDQEEAQPSRFWVICLIANIVWTAALLLIVPYGILKLITKNITNQDADESTKKAQKRMAIYGELSYYEWRTHVNVFFKIMRKYIRIAEVDEEKEEAVIQIDTSPEDVLLTLLLDVNFLCEMRQETKEEYVARRMEEKFYRPDPEDKRQRVKRNLRKKRSQLTFEEQFDLIVKHAGDDVFKGYYLGRWLVFRRKTVGSGGKMRPSPKEDLAPSHG